MGIKLKSAHTMEPLWGFGMTKKTSNLNKEIKQLISQKKDITRRLSFLLGESKCRGIEIEPGVYSGCTGTGGDCPICGK